MKRVVFGITSLETGGAERVLIDIVDHFKDQYDITIFTIYGNGDLIKSIDPKIRIVSMINKKYQQLSWLNKKVISLVFSFQFLLRLIYNHYIKNKFDEEIAFLEGPITSLFACKSSARKIVWVHTNLEYHIINKFRKKQYIKNYQKYNKIIFVSQDALNGFNNLYNIDVEQQIIHNYLNIKNVVDKARKFEPKEIDTHDNIPNFIIVCRLAKAKALDRLALVSQKLLENGFNHRIYVVGSGPESDNLQLLINKAKLQSNFIFIGQRDNPYPYIKKATCFLLPSLYEGYGMVLVEAMVLKKYIIITDTGAKEAIAGYNNKLVVDNSFDGLYDGLSKFIKGNFKPDKNPIINYNGNVIIKEIKNLLEE